jgi:hypothetical protein
MAYVNVEEIRSALKDTPLETLADALAIVLAEGKTPSQAVAGSDRPELVNFAQAVIYLKKNYDFEELEYFTTEADLVYVNAGDRRILLTDRMNTMPTTGGNNSSGKEENSSSSNTASGSNGRFSNLEI